MNMAIVRTRSYDWNECEGRLTLGIIEAFRKPTGEVTITPLLMCGQWTPLPTVTEGQQTLNEYLLWLMYTKHLRRHCVAFCYINYKRARNHISHCGHLWPILLVSQFTWGLLIEVEKGRKNTYCETMLLLGYCRTWFQHMFPIPYTLKLLWGAQRLPLGDHVVPVWHFVSFHFNSFNMITLALVGLVWLSYQPTVQPCSQSSGA